MPENEQPEVKYGYVERIYFTDDQVAQAIAFVQERRPDLLKLLQDVIAGRRVVVDMIDDEDYREKDVYWRSMEEFIMLLEESGMVKGAHQRSNLFSDIKKKLKQCQPDCAPRHITNLLD